MSNPYASALMAAGICLAGAAAFAQDDAQAPLSIYFDSGSARVGAPELGKLDRAARLFRDGNPIVMIVAGGADTVGDPDLNLALSIRRAQGIAGELVARGIPVERLQVLGRGNSELAVETPTDTERRENRVVEISWR